MLLWHHQCLKIHNKVSFRSNVSETGYDYFLSKYKYQPWNLLMLANFGAKIQIFETHRISKWPNKWNFLTKWKNVTYLLIFKHCDQKKCIMQRILLYTIVFINNHDPFWQDSRLVIHYKVVYLPFNSKYLQKSMYVAKEGGFPPTICHSMMTPRTAILLK